MMGLLWRGCPVRGGGGPGWTSGSWVVWVHPDLCNLSVLILSLGPQRLHGGESDPHGRGGLDPGGARDGAAGGSAHLGKDPGCGQELNTRGSKPTTPWAAPCTGIPRAQRDLEESPQLMLAHRLLRTSRGTWSRCQDMSGLLPVQDSSPVPCDVSLLHCRTSVTAPCLSSSP